MDVIALEGDSQTVQFRIGVGGHAGTVKDMAVARCGIWSEHGRFTHVTAAEESHTER